MLPWRRPWGTIWREYTGTLIQKQIIHKSVRIYQTVLPIKQVYVEQNIEKDEPMEGEKGNKAEDNQTNAGNDTQTDENSQNTPPNNNENTTPVQPENQAPLPVSSPTENPAFWTKQLATPAWYYLIGQCTCLFYPIMF